MMARIAMLCLALAVSACAGSGTPPPGPVRVVVRQSKPVPPAPECDPATDPVWRDVPEGNVSRSESARLWRANKNAFAALIDRRRVCWAPHVARGTSK